MFEATYIQMQNLGATSGPLENSIIYFDGRQGSVIILIDDNDNV